MAIVGSILQEVIKKKKVNLDKRQLNVDLQKNTLKKLLHKASKTDFGRDYHFAKMLSSANFLEEFRQQVPVFDYEKIFEQYWHKMLEGKVNVTWPGKIKYFGLTSGTSNDSSKRVPLSGDMIRSIRRTGIRQLLSLAEFDLPPYFYEKSVLMVGGSTSLVKMEKYFEGDLSGILASRLPFWFNRFYKPGAISKEKDWNTKLDKIVKKAINWDIGGITGVPAWVQILLERIIEHYNLNTIHDLWPNFRVFSHGGVNFAPYKKSFEKLMGKEVFYLETYLASEGFLAYQRKKDHEMQLVLDNGLFYEFIPFNTENFTPDGQMVENPKTLLLDEVIEGGEYALLLSTNAGAWRYLIGDTIKFTDLEKSEVVITGRIKHFLSLTGEHLSVENMNKAIELVSEEFNIYIPEYTVVGFPYETLFAHKWYVATNDEVDTERLRKKIDENLRVLNDDYATERDSALQEVFLEVLPEEKFMKFMELKGKLGSQHKFPRVMKGKMLEEWNRFLESGNI